MINTDDQLDYIDQVFDRARKLVQTRVWDDIKAQRLEAWLGCLRNHEAELLGAYLLDNLCFRSRDQFFSMLDTLFIDMPAHPSDPSEGGRLVDRLQKRPNAAIGSVTRIAPVIGFLSPPTKSGPYILRLAQRRYGIHSDWLIWSHQIDTVKSLNELIFVDDFCGSGKQFTDFAKSIRLDDVYKSHPKMHVTYLVAAAHESGIERIQKELPYVHVKYAEQLGTATSLLTDACFARYEIEGFRKLILEQYERVTTEAGLPTRGKLANGFGDLSLAYAFAHATPNNTLPIFWYETEQWTPLLDR